MNQTRIALSIQFLHSFVSGILGVAIPLMMKERNVNVVVIGLVFATMPLIMQFGRMFFATLSDFLGRKLFFISNGVLGVISSLIYYVAHTPLEFLFGKVTEGTKEGSIWAVNRAFLLEKESGCWRILVYLRTVVYVGFAIGSLLTGFLVVWLFFDGTMLLCAILGVFVFFLALLLPKERKEQFSMVKALQFLDFRKKKRAFKIFLFLFSMIGLSYGFRGSFIIPLFLDRHGFDAEKIGLIIGLQILFAGFSSYLFSKTAKLRQMILLQGILFSLFFFSLGFLSSMAAGVLLVVYGFIEGIASIGQEGILSKICDKESYGTDIGLLMFGLHVGETLSLALSGFLIEVWGFVVPFSLTALTYAIYYIPSYMILKE
ncbi:MAG: MFS transporter [Candidatus Bathycorpusculaceae bacterium]